MSILPLTMAKGTESCRSKTMSYGDLKKHSANKMHPNDCNQNIGKIKIKSFTTNHIIDKNWLKKDTQISVLSSISIFEGMLKSSGAL